MGNFKRYDGYVMHIPQEFIDGKLPVCPFCKSDNPHWLLDSKMEMSLAGSRTYYQCERCQAILSSTAADAGAEKGKSFAINPAMAAMNAAQKGTKHQEVGVAYMRVETLGLVCTDQSLMGKEFPITYFQEMAKPKAAFCSNCGTPLKDGAQFCTGCGTQVASASPAPAPAVVPAADAVVIPPVRPVEEPVSQEPVVLEAPVPAPAAPVPEAAPAAAPAPYQFPVAPLILVGVAALYALVMMFAYPFHIGFFISDLFGLVPYVLMILGLVLCKKEKNILFGVGFLVFAAAGFLAFIMSLVSYSQMGIDISVAASNLLLGLFGLIPMALIGIHYLIGKAKALKIIGVILKLLLGFISMIVSLVNYPDITNVLAFLFGTVCLMVAALLYNPGKKAN